MTPCLGHLTPHDAAQHMTVQYRTVQSSARPPHTPHLMLPEHPCVLLLAHEHTHGHACTPHLTPLALLRYCACYNPNAMPVSTHIWAHTGPGPYMHCLTSTANGFALANSSGFWAKASALLCSRRYSFTLARSPAAYTASARQDTTNVLYLYGDRGAGCDRGAEEQRSLPAVKC